MIVKTEDNGLFGPFVDVQVGRAWLVCDGAHLPFSLCGNYELLDIPVPSGHRAEDYDYIDGVLVLKEQPQVAQFV